MNQVTIAHAALDLAHKELWEAQLSFWPGSARLSATDLIKAADLLRFEQNRTRLLRTMAHCLQYPVHVFYQTREGHIGCRYGLEGPDYISGFTINGELPE